jgi:hypothetical protein
MCNLALSHAHYQQLIISPATWLPATGKIKKRGRTMKDWQLVYATLAGVTATLSGLLFVSVSVSLNTADGAERQRLLFVATRSFLDFLSVLALSIFFLVPELTVLMAGLSQLMVGLLRTGWHLRHWLRRSHQTQRKNLLQYLVPTFATIALLFAGGFSLALGKFVPGLTLFAVMGLAFGACQNAWRLLVR